MWLRNAITLCVLEVFGMSFVGPNHDLQRRTNDVKVLHSRTHRIHSVLNFVYTETRMCPNMV
jgi:hypothetical protein